MASGNGLSNPLGSQGFLRLASLLLLSGSALVSANVINTQDASPASSVQFSQPEITEAPKLEVRQLSPQGYSTFWHAISSINGDTSCE
jgi:hypothetical protein